MIRPRARLVLFALLCAVVLSPRLGGAHLHLCLDGSSPLITLHVSDVESPDGAHGAGESHDDQTVDVSNPVLGKVWPPGFDGGLLLVLVLLLGTAGVSRPLTLSTWLAPPGVPPFLRPPLRGPPA